MIKKIKDLTLEEMVVLCGHLFKCENCPLSFLCNDIIFYELDTAVDDDGNLIFDKEVEI